MITQLTNRNRLKCGLSYPTGYYSDFWLALLFKQEVQAATYNSGIGVGLGVNKALYIKSYVIYKTK